MPWWYYLVALFAALFGVNGIPHFTQGLAGKKFPTPFSGGPGTEGSAGVNVLWGGGNLVVAGILLWVIRDGLADLVVIVEMIVVGLAFGTLMGTAFGNPERYGRNRKR
jgi:hypothetical protein